MLIEDSQRLSYALMTVDDSELMFQLDQDPQVMHYITGGKATSRKDIEEIFLPRLQSYTNLAKGWGLWKTMLKHEQSFLGWILVRPANYFSDKPQFNNLELGWRFKREAWGCGYATEAAVHILQALASAGSARRFSAIAVEDNSSSIKIMHKLGMKYVKTYTHKDPLGEEEVVYYQVDV
ncbi:MAG: GNAT family N-acetyltransferase [Xanthomonadales bacterium]|nr:GNAT family N-acetyltransferase [Xanthomonadales bacterium]